MATSNTGWRSITCRVASRTRRVWGAVTSRRSGSLPRVLVQQAAQARAADDLARRGAASFPAAEPAAVGSDAVVPCCSARRTRRGRWLRQGAEWLARLEAGGQPPVVNLRPAADWPDTATLGVDLAWVRAVLDRIAADLDELARAREVADLDTAAVRADQRAERRHRLAEPDLDFRNSCTRQRLPPRPRSSWSGPGMRGRPNGTAAARSTRGSVTPTTRSGRAEPPARDGVQEPGRRSGGHGSFLRTPQAVGSTARSLASPLQARCAAPCTQPQSMSNRSTHLI